MTTLCYVLKKVGEMMPDNRRSRRDRLRPPFAHRHDRMRVIGSRQIEPMKVLIVDDDREVRTLGLLSLRRAPGWQALAAADGLSALKLARSESPEAILLDMQMPGMDGLETLAALQKQASTSTIPVVFLTAQADDKDIARYRQLGARGVIRKPFAPLSLPDLLLAALSPKR